MAVDPFVDMVIPDIYLNYAELDGDPIANIEASVEANRFRDDLAEEMFTRYRGG